MTTAVSPQNLHPPRKPDREDDENRYYDDVAFASDSYVPWIVGSLRLGKADLSRMRSSGCPVLRAHNGDNLVGQVLRVEKSEGLWKSNWRLPKIAANADTFAQMDSRILMGISVGGALLWDTLVIDNPDETDFDKVLFTCDWLLIEESLTPIPADTRAGVDRSHPALLERDGAIFDTIITPSGITTKETPDVMQRLQTLVRTHNENIAVRRQEQSSMTTLPEIKDIPAEVIERAIQAQLERSESLKALTQLPSEIAKLSETVEAETIANMEYRAKLDRLQFQPGGQVPQMDNWKPSDRRINLGKVLQLTRTEDGHFPDLDMSTCTFEESVLERANLGKPGRNSLARIPWLALATDEQQMQIQRSTMAEGAGIRGLETDTLGDGGLVLSSWAPILSRMNVRLGVTGAQKLPWSTSQPTALAAAEGSDIPVTDLVLNNTEYLPKSIASAYRITSSLRAVDDGVFEGIARMAISQILQDEVTGQVLDGGGTHQINGLWNTTGVQNTDYGAAIANFERDDIVDWFDDVRLSKTDGGMYTAVLGDSLWKLCEKTPRGIDGTSSAGFTQISQYLLETTTPHMGQMEREVVLHYADFAPSGAVNPGLFFAADRQMIWFWGDSLSLDFVPQLSRSDVWKMCAEVEFASYRPADNASRIKQD